MSFDRISLSAKSEYEHATSHVPSLQLNRANIWVLQKCNAFNFINFLLENSCYKGHGGQQNVVLEEDYQVKVKKRSDRPYNRT